MAPDKQHSTILYEFRKGNNPTEATKNILCRYESAVSMWTVCLKDALGRGHNRAGH